ncbi:DUF4958 family protein [Halosquirtibacter xylanolyticus]|uniref:surface glycan-binding family protein n=1 Tax=Halosquirtibacter xylanolyticus TaxID=3374599 RepID=UPI00374875BA|nr:DUF4958 family protein [Prolixibacteraceae bacterium]
MKTNIFIRRPLFLIMLIATIGLFSCEEKHELRDAGVTPQISYDLSTSDANVNASIMTITSDGTKFQTEAYTSNEPKTNCFITSYVLKKAMLGDQNKSINLFNLNKDSGVITVAKGNHIDPGTYVLEIQVNSSRNSSIIKDAFKIEVVETGAIYNNRTAFIGKDFLSGVPEIKGNLTNVKFKIEGDAHGFVIDETSGEVSLEAANALKAGDYELDVRLIYDGGELSFPNAIQFVIEKEIIAPSAFSYPETNVEKGLAMLIDPIITGNDLTFEFKQTPPAGFVLNDKTGVVSLPLGHTLSVGEYNVEITASNSKGTADAAIKVNIVHPIPKALQYAINEVRIVQGSGFTSVEPTMTNNENVTYALTDKQFAISDKGVISLADANGVAEGDYELNVEVTYPGGKVTFDKAYTVHISSGVIAPTVLTYLETTVVQGVETVIVPNVDGVGVTFKSKNPLPAGITLNKDNGVITLGQNNSIAVQDHEIIIIGGNSKGELEASFTLHVESQPSDFSYAVNEIVTGNKGFTSDMPTITDGIGVAFSIDQQDKFIVNPTNGEVGVKEGVYIPGGVYDLTVTADKRGFKLTTSYKVTMWEVKYTPNVLEGTTSDALEGNIPDIVEGPSVPDKILHEVRGVYYTGTINGVDYKDVLIKGGAANFTPEVKEISTALDLVKSGNNFNTNKFRDWVGVPPDAAGKVGKGIWDGKIKVKSGKLIPGHYSMVTRLCGDGVKAEMHHTIDIVIK